MALLINDAYAFLCVTDDVADIDTERLGVGDTDIVSVGDIVVDAVVVGVALRVWVVDAD